MTTSPLREGEAGAGSRPRGPARGRNARCGRCGRRTAVLTRARWTGLLPPGAVVPAVSPPGRTVSAGAELPRCRVRSSPRTAPRRLRDDRPGLAENRQGLAVNLPSPAVTGGPTSAVRPGTGRLATGGVPKPAPADRPPAARGSRLDVTGRRGSQEYGGLDASSRPRETAAVRALDAHRHRARAGRPVPRDQARLPWPRGVAGSAAGPGATPDGPRAARPSRPPRPRRHRPFRRGHRGHPPYRGGPSRVRSRRAARCPSRVGAGSAVPGPCYPPYGPHAKAGNARSWTGPNTTVRGRQRFTGWWQARPCSC